MPESKRSYQSILSTGMPLRLEKHPDSRPSGSHKVSSAIRKEAENHERVSLINRLIDRIKAV